MPVPETTIHHYYNTIPWQNNIRTTRQFLIVQAKPESTGMKPLPNHHFGLGVLAMDT
jgi:hypothetical protein